MAKRTTKKETQVDVIERFNWKRVETPRSWAAKEGDEIAGYYLGTTLRDGQHGQYSVVLIAVPDVGVHMITGTMIIQMVQAALVPIGSPVRVKFLGLVPTAAGHQMKTFEVLVPDGDALNESDRPGIA